MSSFLQPGVATPYPEVRSKVAVHELEVVEQLILAATVFFNELTGVIVARRGLVEQATVVAAVFTPYFRATVFTADGGQTAPTTGRVLLSQCSVISDC